MKDETVRSHQPQYTSHIVKVLKASQVQVDGTFRLDYSGSGSAPVRTESANVAQADAHVPPEPVAGVPQEVRIIESNSDYAIIEVVCSCGSKCHVQCNYADIVNPGGAKPDVVTNDPPAEEVAAAEKKS